MRGTRVLLGVLLALGLGVTSCGDSDDGAGSDTDTAADETSDGAEDGAPTSASAGDDEVAAPAPEQDADEADAEDTTEATEPSAPEVTEMGSFVVNGTEFAVTFLNRCIPFGGDDGVTIDLQPIAQGQGAQLNLYGTADSVEVSVQGQKINELFGSISFAADPFGSGLIEQSTIDGDRWSGSATLDDALDAVDGVSITWDVMIPEEILDCS